MIGGLAIGSAPIGSGPLSVNIIMVAETTPLVLTGLEALFISPFRYPDLSTISIPAHKLDIDLGLSESVYVDPHLSDDVKVDVYNDGEFVLKTKPCNNETVEVNNGIITMLDGEKTIVIKEL